MKNLFTINKEEKNRILNLHESATKRHYLSEQPMLDLGQPSQPEIGPQLLQNTSGIMVKQGIPPDPYVYAKMGDNYYYSKDNNTDNPNWTLAVKEKAINAIKSKIFNQEIPVDKTITPPKKEDDKKEDDNKKPIIPNKESERQTNITKVYCSVKNGMITTGSIKNTKWGDYVKSFGVTSKDIETAKKYCPKKEDDNKKKTNVVLSPFINPKFKSKIDVSKLSTTDPVKIFSALPNTHCAKFVNDFDDSRAKILNAWTAHDVPSVGDTIFSSFTNLNSDQIDDVTDLWKDINSDSKGKGNTYSSEVAKLVSSIVPKTPRVSLKLNDVVGLFYPGSKHHEEAFYEAGKKFFRKNMLGMTVNGETIKKGIGWGMNTHIGVVGAIKDGVPIVFHNIGGQVWADPYNNLKGGSRIAWVKRA